MSYKLFKHWKGDSLQVSVEPMNQSGVVGVDRREWLRLRSPLHYFLDEISSGNVNLLSGSHHTEFDHFIF